MTLLILPQVILNQPYWKGCDSILKSKIIKSIWDSRKPTTIAKYCQTLRKFFDFCHSNNFAISIPFDSLIIAQYLEQIKDTTPAKSAVTNGLLCLKWLHSFKPGLNSSNDPANDLFLSKIVESSNRNSYQSKKRKKPLSPDMIKGILGLLPREPTLTQLRDCLIPVLSYALLLRHDETAHLNCNHITEDSDGFKIIIPSSKTDTYREGKIVYLSKNNRSLSDLLLRYLSKANLNLTMNHFLFGPIKFDKSSSGYTIENKKLSYECFNKIMKDAVSRLGYNPDDFGTHSARSGGATCLAPHISEYNLMLNGRWSDPRSIGSYVETPSAQRFEINEILDINL